MDTLIYALLTILLSLSLAFSNESDTQSHLNGTNAVVDLSPANSSTLTSLADLNEVDATFLGKPVRNVKCRNTMYPGSNSTRRARVPFSKVDWEVRFRDYTPINYTTSYINHKLGADPEIGDPGFRPVWNTFDGEVNRKSYYRNYNVVDDYPLNPFGRTGVIGRGVLPRWGPNFEICMIITRWLTATPVSEPILHQDSKFPILQMLASMITRTTSWTTPRGFLLPGETYVDAIKRVFFKYYIKVELMKKKGINLEEVENRLEVFFKSGRKIYKGYVDDTRNTDNSWVESVVLHCHCTRGDFFKGLIGQTGRTLKWLLVNKSLKLNYAQGQYLEFVAQEMKSHW